MSDYLPVKGPSGFRIPPWVFALILIGVVLLAFWLNPNYLRDSIERPTFLISEIQASNWTTVVDSDGDHSDWIEIHNPSQESQALTGWYLTDDFKELTKWRFPELVLEGGGFLVVFASGKDRRQLLDDLHTNFKLNELGEYLALVDPSGKRVVHEFLPKYPPLSGDDSFGIRSSFFEEVIGRLPGAYRRTAYFSDPTPGGPNTREFWGQVSDTHFSKNGGYVDEPFLLELDTDTPRATIRYTLDGSWPSANHGIEYEKPIAIDHTTVIRVTAFRDNYKASNTDTQTYLFREQVFGQRGRGMPETWGTKGDWSVPADYEMDPEILEDPIYQDRLQAALNALPALSIVVDQADLFGRQRGIYANPEASGRAWERPGTMEVLFTDGRKTFRENCGIRIQGGWSRRPEESPKHSFRLVFREQYGTPELNYPLFGEAGAKRFKNLILRAGCNNTWLHWNHEERERGDLLRDEWMRRSLAALKRPANSGRFVHLFLNGLYWGIYNPCERPDAYFQAHLEGIDAAEFESRNASKILSGSDDAWLQLFELANGVEEGGAGYESIGALLDIDEFIDFMLVQIYGGSSDWDRASNWYAGRRASANGKFRFFLWDGERSLEGLDVDITRFDDDLSPTRLFQRLRRFPEFRSAFAQRARKVLGSEGVLGPRANRARYERLANQLRDAVILESARWGDYRRDVHPYRVGPYELYTPATHWEPEVERLLDLYFPNRTQRLIPQLEAIGLW